MPGRIGDRSGRAGLGGRPDIVSSTYLVNLPPDLLWLSAMVMTSP
jgi:hypothetical protein